uniref:SecA DEAD-like N-terminal domain-containing protein n=1 Tax=Eutreptiella gymnastica TaxID=73025 RepID=A0A7S4GCW1_9EUGL
MVEPLRRKYDIFKPELYHWPRIKQDCVLLDAIRAIHVPPSCQNATFRDTAAEVHHVLQGKVQEYYQHCGQEFHKNAAEREPNLRQAYDLLCHLQAIARHFPLSPTSDPRIDEVECRTGQLRDLVVKIAQAPSQWSLDQLQQYCVHLSGMSSPEFTACKDQITQYITASQQHMESLIERAKQALINTDFEAFRRCAPNLEPAHWQILIPDVEESMLRSLSVLKPIVSAPVITVAAANGDRVHVQKIVNFLEQCRDSSLLRRFPVDTTIANECTTALETLREKRSDAQAKLIQCFELPSLCFSDIRQCFGMGYLYNTRASQETVEDKVMQLGSQFLSAEVSDVVLDEMNKFFELGCDSVIVTTLSLEGLVQLAKDKLRQQFNVLADTIRNQDLHLAEEKLDRLRGRLHNQPPSLRHDVEGLVTGCEENVRVMEQEMSKEFQTRLDTKYYADAVELLNAHYRTKKIHLADKQWRAIRCTAQQLVDACSKKLLANGSVPPPDLNATLDETEKLANAINSLHVASESKMKADIEFVRESISRFVKESKERLVNTLDQVRAAALNQGSDGRVNVPLQGGALNNWLHVITTFDQHPAVGNAEYPPVVESVISWFTSVGHTLATQVEKLRHADATIDFEWLGLVLNKFTPHVIEGFMNFCTKHDVAADTSVFVNAPTITEELKASGEQLAADALLKVQQQHFHALGNIHSILYQLSSKCNVHGPHQQVKAALGDYVAELESEVTTKFNQDCDANDAVLKLVKLQNQHNNKTLNSDCYDAMNKINANVKTTLEQMSTKVRPDGSPMDNQSTRTFAGDVVAILKKQKLVRLVEASKEAVNQVLTALLESRWAAVMKHYSGSPDAEDMALQYFSVVADLLKGEKSGAGSELVNMFKSKYFAYGGQQRRLPHKAVPEIMNQLQLNPNISTNLSQLLPDVQAKVEALQQRCVALDSAGDEAMVREIVAVVKSEQYKPGFKRNGLAHEDVCTFIAHVVILYWLLSAPDVQLTTVKARQTVRKLAHPVQVLGILRLLGWDCADGQMVNHMVQIPTGEGKSIVVALTAAIKAVHGFSVDVVCYSEYLTTRDFTDFKVFFKELGVEDRIRYMTFQQLCECHIGELRKAAVDIVMTGATSVTDNPADRNQRILMIDEVDVFFTRRFYGNTYNAGALLRSPEAAAFIAYVWNNRSQQSEQDMMHSKEYQDLMDCYPSCPNLIRWACSALVANHSKPTNNAFFQNDRVVYKDKDGNVNPHMVYPNRTVFAYLQGHSTGQISEAALIDALGLHFFCGKFSYAAIPNKMYGCIVGVTGTLNTLTPSEKAILDNEYRVERLTYVPSVYNPSRTFDFTAKFVSIQPTEDAWLRAIETVVQECMHSRQPLLVYFKNTAAMQLYRRRFADRPVVYVPHDDEKIHIQDSIERAGSPGQITFFTRLHGRGADFVFDKTKVPRGLLVLLTYFPSSLSEEVQIKGRCGRQGEAGEFRMCMCATHLEKKGIHVSPQSSIDEPLAEHLRAARERITVKKQETRSMHKQDADAKDKEAWELMALMFNPTKSLDRKRKAIENCCISNLSTKRLIILLLDASGSMRGSRWNKLEQAVSAYLNKYFRLKGEFESQHRTFVTVIPFHGQAWLHPQFTCQPLATAYRMPLGPQPSGGTDFSKAFACCRQHIATVASNDPEMNYEILFLTDGAGNCGGREASALLASYGPKVLRYTSFIYDSSSENEQVSLLNKTFGDTIGFDNVCCRLVSSTGQQTGVEDITVAFTECATDEPMFLRADKEPVE